MLRKLFFSVRTVLVQACLWILVMPFQGAHATTAPTTGFVWPLVPTPKVVRDFDAPLNRWDSGHRGVDLSSQEGAKVHSAGEGTVVFAQVINGVGSVSVEHRGGWRTTYQPVTLSVHRGQKVVAGEILGVLLGGHPGCPVSACLHWGLKRGHAPHEQYANPLVLVGEIPIRLKPVSTRSVAGFSRWEG